MKRPAPTHPIDATVMRRLDALEILIDLDYAEKPSIFQQKTGIKMAQVWQWFSGYRALRDKALRRLEEKTGKCEGWFDGVRTPAETSKAIFIAPASIVEASASQKFPRECQMICDAFSTLPDDPMLRMRVMGQIEQVISSARDSPDTGRKVSRGPDKKPSAA